MNDSNGIPLTGEGVTVADFDTGVLYFHAGLFKLSEDVFEWLDVDGSGDLSAGDAVDLDDDGIPDAGESLRYLEANFTDQYGNGPGYDADFDFLYNDADDSGTREYGPPAFGENDPTYGERIFLTEDGNENGQLDPGERLLALGESKIRAIHNRDGSVHRRGVDLLSSETDYWGHGTPVTGIYSGGWPNLHGMSGIAPSVESLHFVNDYISEPPFLVPIEAGLLWARDEGTDIVLIEDGEWAWEFLDGSSNVEIMINELSADDGLIFVVPAGNLATGRMHTSFSSSDGTVLQGQTAHIFWIDFLWTDPVEHNISITPPNGTPIVLNGDGGTQIEQGHRFYSLLSVSDRGTSRFDLRIASDPEGDFLFGSWTFAFDGPATDMHGFFADDVSGWISNSSWHVLDESHTVAWPATADSAISVAAYNPDGDGDINSYSGWGPRIDGRPDVDLAAPGSTVFSTHPFLPDDYTSFGGTSAAGPHVAGAVAILKQLMPSMDSGLCRAFLRIGAAQDEYTDDPDRWGAGKLRIYPAVVAAITEVEETVPHPELQLAAYPNPFNPATTLRFYLPETGPATLRAFTVNGRQVWSRRLGASEPGWREIKWNAHDSEGRALSSGLYFIHVKQGQRVAATRVTLLK
jgi:subtilisin family serine protease